MDPSASSGTLREQTLASGLRLGRYEIRSKIGEGGMGEVYLAQDVELDRPAALKFLLLELASDQKRLSRFFQEAKAASALNHPNILTVYEIEYLNAALAERDPYLTRMDAEPYFGRFRSDPRYRDLLQRMNLDRPDSN